jgi:glycosyltransferase involved in cell wall biosynthesis
MAGDFMNILFYGTYPPPFGGTSNHILDFAKYIKENIHHNAFFYGYTKERYSPHCKIIKGKDLNLNKFLIAIKKLDVLRKNKYCFKNIKEKLMAIIEASYIEQAIKQYEIDAVLVHHFGRGRIFSLVDPKIRNKVISFLTFFGECYIPSYEKKDFIEIALNFDRLFSCSKFCMDSFFKLKNVDRSTWGKKLDYMYYGVPAQYNIDMSNVDSKIRKLADNYEIIFNLANHLERMGQDIILKAVNKISRKKIENIKFIIAGNNFPFTNRLRYYIKKYNLEENVVLLGTLNEDEKNYLIKKSLFVIIAARTKIACSSVFSMEAMRYGKPIIISKIAGHPEMIENKKNGEFFRNDDHLELSKKILKFIKNRDLLYKYGNLSGGIFREKFINHRCFELYLTALSKSRGEKNG